MGRSTYAEAVDEIQGALRPTMVARGYRVRGRTFNRLTEDGLTQVVNIQMGPSDPPGTTYVEGLTQNLHGLFAVNLGVHVPEVAQHHGGGGPRAWVQEYHCSIRTRLGDSREADRGIWWRASADLPVVADVKSCLEGPGFSFLDRFATRAKILAEWREQTENVGAGSPPRIVMAIILAERGDAVRARQLLLAQAGETCNPKHPEYVRALAMRMGLGSLGA
jgi:hypothetical protein